VVIQKWDLNLGHLTLESGWNFQVERRLRALPLGEASKEISSERHLQFKTISSRKHKSNHSLSPKQLQSLVLCVLVIVLFHFLSSLLLAVS
jgi:hypothetical protein